MRRVALAALLACTSARLAHAQPVPPAPAPAPAPADDTDPAAQKGDARALLQLGVKLLKSNDYLGALAVFKDAYRRFPSAKILIDIGTTLRSLNRNAEAANAYQQYLRSPDEDPQLHDEIVKDLAELDAGLARLAITAPAGAEIQVDEQDWVPAAAAALVRVAPGQYEVHARATGDKPFATAGEIALGAQVAVTVALEAIPEKEIIVRVPETAPVVLVEPRSRLGALAFGHFDFSGGGAGLVGATVDVTDRLEVEAAAVLGPNYGGYAAASFAILTGSLRPIVSVGMPVFASDGARYAVRGAGGLELVANRHFALIVELGVEHNLNPQTSVDVGGMARSITATSLIPALGVSARL
jgi:hypothetical protein